jgi:pimeloyl-ACP methyl ester carboxylesterase
MMDAQQDESQINWVEVSGRQKAKLATEQSGSGSPFVWGHSLLGSMSQDLDGGVLAWRELTDIASVIRFDARGHGQSDCEGEPEDFSWKNLATNMWEVIDNYTDADVVLGGASMGCATSLHAAVQQPERVKGLVLVIPPTAWETREKMKRNYRFIANFINVTRALPLRLLRFVRMAQDGDNFQKDMLAILTKHVSRANYRGMVGAMRGAALSDLPSKKALAQLTMPTLILAWPDDATHPLAVAEELRDTMPGARLEVVENERDPYQWPQLVREFIASLD